MKSDDFPVPRRKRPVAVSEPRTARDRKRIILADMRHAATVPLIATALGLTTVAGAESPVLFNRDIRPIFSENCFACHGPDEAKRMTPLRLDTEDGAFSTLSGGGKAIVPGDPAGSELFLRVSSPDPGRRMPPAAFGHDPLAQRELDLIRDWIAQGAEWQGHWSFIAPRRPAVPADRYPGWPVNAVDSFVLRRLNNERLEPSPPASRETLIRRLSLDLTGTPPELGAVDAFLQDESPDAYETVVERLLSSPRYGERMAIRWLDAARYADTNGYQTDAERDMWRWRDWVIEAFAANKPFNEFTVEQLAGDMLPSASLDQIIATGFNRNHRGNGEGGIVDAEYAVEYVVDRVDTTSTVWMGLTLGCARCHDHKYDPVTQKEYYELFAYFNNVPEKGQGVQIRQLPALHQGANARAGGDPVRAQRQTRRTARAASATLRGRCERATAMGADARGVAFGLVRCAGSGPFVPRARGGGWTFGTPVRRRRLRRLGGAGEFSGSTTASAWPPGSSRSIRTAPSFRRLATCYRTTTPRVIPAGGSI